MNPVIPLLLFLLVSSMSCTTNTKSDLDIQGHRGARAIYPENSIPGFLYALKLGIKTLELDLGVTKDDVLIVYHDQTINPEICRYLDGRAAPKDVPVHSLTFEQIKEFDCGSLGNKRFPKQKMISQTQIPSLEELFETVLNQDHPNAQNVWFNIETKSHPDHPHLQPAPEKFVSLILDLVDKYDLGHRVIIQSFDHRTIKVAKKLRPEIKTAALFYERPKGSLVNATKEAAGDIISPFYEWVTKEDVTALHRAGIPIIPWTANTEASWRTLIDLKVDGIITDDPEGLLRYSTTSAPSR